MVNKVRNYFRTLTADTFALLVHGTITSASTYVYEVVFFSVHEEKWLAIRILYNLFRYASARVPAKLAYYFERSFLKNSENRFYEAIADWLALSIHQIPLYIISAALFRMNWKTILYICLVYLFDNFIFGWLYGVLLKWMRGKFLMK